ncbi:MAG: hypothetical protein H7Y42_10165 [Chitinophagaceae bacterium]|nr:hypothetical protein [Chitinophagaceae bacterium]
MIRSVTTFILLLLFVPAFSQELPGLKVTIKSAVLNETRNVQVYLPYTSKPGRQQFPVIYVLDGESLYWPTIGAMRFMNYSSSLPQAPEAIIVSIPNTKRERDMPVPQDASYEKNAGTFLRFLSEELVPQINARYPVSGLNILIGHSQGGLFATYAGVERPNLFRFILAMDAPMTINKALLDVFTQKMDKTCGIYYFSAESLYGWGSDFKMLKQCDSYGQIRIEAENHESMPYKGIYEGLKFLFREHIPAMADIDIGEIRAYYERLSEKLNTRYAVPAKLLLARTVNAISRSDKPAALALINYYEQEYGTTPRSSALHARANAISKGPDERVRFYLAQESPTEDAIKPYLGKWRGILKVPGGTDTPIAWEIKKVNGRYVMDSRIMDQFNSKSDFLTVTRNNELAWGRKHQAGGIYLSLGTLSKDGQTLSGTENLIGVEMPVGAPAFKVNSFEFRKVGE